MYNLGNAGMASAIWGAVSAVLAIVGGITLYFTFLRKSNNGKFKGFLGWMYDFLSFKKMMVEDILRVLYLICAIAITLSSFALIGQNFLAFILTLVLGNVAVRMGFELTLVVLVICRNTTQINDKLGKSAKVVPVEEEKAE